MPVLSRYTLHSVLTEVIIDATMDSSSAPVTKRDTVDCAEATLKRAKEARVALYILKKILSSSIIANERVK